MKANLLMNYPQINGSAASSSGVFTGLAPGTYEVNIADSRSCIGIVDTTVNSVPGVYPSLLPSSINFSIIQALELETTTITTCFAVPTGQIVGSLNGGVGDYYYSVFYIFLFL